MASSQEELALGQWYMNQQERSQVEVRDNSSSSLVEDHYLTKESMLKLYESLK